MGEFANSRVTSVIAWAVATIILLLNFEYVWLIFRAL
jgi:Mn2+/Fe2+ NRAMP family transporter